MEKESLPPIPRQGSQNQKKYKCWGENMPLAASQLLPLSSLNFYVCVGGVTTGGAKQCEDVKEGGHGPQLAFPKTRSEMI